MGFIAAKINIIIKIAKYNFCYRLKMFDFLTNGTDQRRIRSCDCEPMIDIQKQIGAGMKPAPTSLLLDDIMGFNGH